MGTLVTYRPHDAVAAITMDDGKVNVLSLAMLTELDAALDRAEADRAVVVLTGRDGVFSAGFDLPVLRAGGTEAADLLRAGFDLARAAAGIPDPSPGRLPGPRRGDGGVPAAVRRLPHRGRRPLQDHSQRGRHRH